MFVTAAQVESRLRVVARQFNLTYTADEQTLISDRTTDAYQLMLGELAARGYSAADVDSWASGAACQMDLALYLILRDLLVTAGADQNLIERYNWLGRLAVWTLLDSSGEVITPSGAPGCAIVDLEEARG